MTQLILTAVCAVLLLNLLVAAVVAARRHPSSWLLVVLLSGTTGAAVAAVMAVLDGEGSRFADVALVLTGTAAVTAAVRATVVPAPQAAADGLPAGASGSGKEH